MAKPCIRIEGARQNNLKGLNLELPLNELIVVTGVSGSGKSSLAFDTVYSEGQRRYVETFSPYARQFLERMDKPSAERIEGIPPAIAIDQTNPVRTSRSTVGTMTELNDHLKLLFARAARLFCEGCGEPVSRDSPQSIATSLLRDFAPGARAAIAFSVRVPSSFTEPEVIDFLTKQGYTKTSRKADGSVEVVQDRVRLQEANRERIVESLEAALKHGRGRVTVQRLGNGKTGAKTLCFSSDLHCPQCDIHYRELIPNHFSFNSPIGACDECRGFGRTMAIDYALVVPDESRTLAEGAIKPWQTKSYAECQQDLLRYARKRGVPCDVPWRKLTAAKRRWVIEGEGEWEDQKWYGVRRFFAWLETKSYKMHIRVLLSKYRAYHPCPACGGARLKPQALNWRLGTGADADAVLTPEERFRPRGQRLGDSRRRERPGLTVHDVMLLPIDRAKAFFERLRLPSPLDEASAPLLEGIRSRLGFLTEVGLGYLTLDRQSRTLSGGEVQRINLTTALGTSLVSTLFVLDEPSIGLHARDMERVIGVLHRLRDAGNSLLVVEHDRQVMLAADRVIDLGPGPGERGGNVVFFGPPDELLNAQGSVTAQYLRGEKQVAAKRARPVARAGGGAGLLEIRGASEHNLKDVDVGIPLNRLVCVTGVSGSGKSTLVKRVCYHGLAKLKGKPVESPGRHRSIRGHALIDAVVLVDQAPIGKTTRSNPASYVGAFEAIRKIFSAEPLARERGYTPGTFSFNSGTGRCPSCGGNGFEHVEMQFLSDVYLRCPDCDGRRYRAEVLEVTTLPSEIEGRPASIAAVLDMTVSEAMAFFSAVPEVRRRLEPLAAVGLAYLKLGQPVPTLSGGEAQRLKLAGHLAKSPPGDTLFLFDEPTTGLHFHDIAILLGALEALIQAGHSVVVIEHNLDVIAAADWVIDLGPEGGDEGGEVIAVGTPRTLARRRRSHTGRALRSHWHEPPAPPPVSAPVGETLPSSEVIRVHHAREHNLKNIDIDIPRDRFTVITGISGSGKSTVAFDILFAEGQRRYLESLNAYARQFVQPAARPDVDAIHGIPPTVAIEQRTSRGGRKSTVATQTEIYHFLRLLFVKLGAQHCPACDLSVEPQSRETIVAQVARDFRRSRVSVLAPLVVARKGYYTDLAKWAAGKGFTHLRVDGALTPTDAWPRLSRFQEHDIELPIGEVNVSARTECELRDRLERALDFGKGAAKVADSTREVIFSTRRACPGCRRSFDELDPRLFSFNSKHGWCPRCYGTGLELEGFDAEQTGEERWWTEGGSGPERECGSCAGRRLRPEALAVRFRDHPINELTARTVAAAEEWFRKLRLRGREAEIARDILAELRARLRFLRSVGLDYLTLDRAAPSLSGGEAQRIRLASQLGSNLRGVCYILDEPTIGLHPRDNRRLLDTLRGLEAKGNTVVVVEHDEETIRAAEHLIDLGPGAGVQGGEVVESGTLADLLANPRSVTGQYLAHPPPHALSARRATVSAAAPDEGDPPSSVRVLEARLHNLKGMDVVFPLRRLVCVTGVSGSGKSTLVRDVLHDNLHHLVGRRRKRGRPALLGCRAIEGWESIERVLEVDQTPIGKTPRSCPATYVGLWTYIRRLYAETAEAKMRGYGPPRFSFNVRGGRCDACEGQGLKKIEMSFLPDVRVTCEVCAGARFTPDTLAVSFKGRSIGDVLAMSVDEAVDFFAAHPPVHHALTLLEQVGLGYLTLGQQSPTLSGGEAQRIKLVTELAKARPAPVRPGRAPSRGSTLYVLDEPTVGLHMADVEKLVGVLHRLVAAGNTVVVIEHNLDVIAESDWIIDLGPEGGNGGGEVIAEGTPDALRRARRNSHTARILRKFLARRGTGHRQAAPTSA